MTRTWGQSFLLVRKLHSPEGLLWTVPKRKLGNHGTESCESIKTCPTYYHKAKVTHNLALFVSSWTSGYSQIAPAFGFFRLQFWDAGPREGQMNLKWSEKMGWMPWIPCQSNPSIHFQNLGSQFPWCEGKGVTSCHEDLICWFLVEHTFLMSCQINKNCTMKFFRKSTAKHLERQRRDLWDLCALSFKPIPGWWNKSSIQYSMCIYIYTWYVVFCMHAYKSDSSPLSSILSINSLSHHSATVTYASFPSPTVIKQGKWTEARQE